MAYFIGAQPMDLIFTSFEVLAVALSLFLIGYLSLDGESNWL